MNSIFINPEKYDWDTYNQILIHEKIHVRQLHSLDILIGEIAIVFQWFNPFIWLYRKAIENNLEYLTDDLVLADKMADKKSYQLSLLKVSTPNYSLRISTNYNQSLLKKRIMMMNAKKSNLHILWKYIMLCPVFIMLAAIFNQPAVSNTVYKGSEDYSNNKINIMMLPSQSNIPNDMEGQWVATVNSEMVKIDLKNSSADHRISNSATFLRKEISSFPIDKKSDFHIKRDAGTIFFNGQFDSVQGNGSYKFVGNQVFKSTLKGSGITDIEESDLFKYLILNVKLDFLKELQSLGYNNLSKDQLASLIVLHIDYAYLSFLSRAGFKHIPLQVLVSAKVIGVDSAYIKEIVNAGYNNLDLTQIINLKMHGVAAAYLAKLSGSGSYGKTNSPSSGKPTPQEIITSKIISQDTVHNFNVAGNIAIDDQKFQKIPLPLAFIKSYENIGFKNLSQNELYSLRTLNITPEYIQAIKNCGFNDITVANLTSLKILNITPEYIKSFQESEHKNVTIKELLSFKIHNVTAKI
ncbi:M56 family metallopeptidase [Mucilaginibacter sp.]|uniref:M56 family metallopeptidase n=1 Tax=Mucilaginibacter sp. TaxID=1882438 RepID=UPI002613890B|nr:M56 family metallopeptidase [Mucilaginibacter sp.]